MNDFTVALALCAALNHLGDLSLIPCVVVEVLSAKLRDYLQFLESEQTEEAMSFNLS